MAVRIMLRAPQRPAIDRISHYVQHLEVVTENPNNYPDSVYSRFFGHVSQCGLLNNYFCESPSKTDIGSVGAWKIRWCFCKLRN